MPEEMFQKNASKVVRLITFGIQKLKFHFVLLNTSPLINALVFLRKKFKLKNEPIPKVC